MSPTEKNAALAEDIRLLGRILGETIRLHEGEETYELIETIRRLAVASRRLEDVASRRALAETLDALADGEAVVVVRAFSYFSMLANIAEDRHHIRRNRENRRAGTPPLASTLRGLFADALARGTTRAEGAATLARIRVTPVLTAHPTEVQRRSTLDLQLAIAGWLAKRDQADLLDEERESAESELRRIVDTLWQTRMLRAVKLGVKDEIENALAYFDYTFIDAVPRLHDDIEDSLFPRSSPSAAGSAATATAIPSSPPRCSSMPSGARPRSPSTTTSRRCTRWVRSCRSPGCWCASRRRWRLSWTPRRTTPPSGRTSPTAAR
jgi:phosphoenolpyruvate carboxylase